MNFLPAIDTKWDLHNWLCQIVFFILTSLFFFYAVISETHGDTAWWYYYGAIASIIITSIGVALPMELLKNITSLTTIMANVFIIPMVLFSAGYDLGMSAGASLIYVIVMGAISPYLVAIGTGIAALSLSIYLHLDNNVFISIPEFKQAALQENLVQDGDKIFAVNPNEPILYRVLKTKTNLIELSIKHYNSGDYAHDIYEANKEKLGEETPNDIKILKDTELVIPNITRLDYKSPITISILYIIAIILGVGWKLYVLKMFELSKSALSNTSGSSETAILNLKDELEQSETNCKLLKEEVAVQIIEMNQLAGLKKEI